MPDSKLTALTELTSVASDDWVYLVDRSDTTDDPAGSSRKALVSTLLGVGGPGNIIANVVETSITGTATLAVSTAYVCSGSSYTVTLPTASGNAGKMISVRMANSLTGRVTLDGNSTETINGSQTRIMWAGESAILISDGTEWLKLGGVSKPMSARMRRTTSSGSLTNNDYTAISLNATDYDFGGMADTINGRINILRPSLYECNSAAQIDGSTGSGAIAFFGPSIYKNGTTDIAATGVSAPAGSYVSLPATGNDNLVAGDYVGLRVYQSRDSGGSNYSLFVSNPNFLEVTEQLSW